MELSQDSITSMLATASTMISITACAPIQKYKLNSQLHKTIEELENYKEYTAKHMISFTKANRQKSQSKVSQMNEKKRFHGFYNAGFIKLYSGNLYNILRFFPPQLYFALKSQIQMDTISICECASTQSYVFQRLFHVLSGTAFESAVLSTVFRLDTIQTLLALGVEYRSIKRNWSDYYSGFWTACLKILVFRSTYTFLYDFMEHCIAKHSRTQSNNAKKPMLNSMEYVILMIGLGYGASLISSFVTYPLDTVVKRQMITNESTTDAFSNIVKKHGWRALLDGISINSLYSLAQTGVFLSAQYGLFTMHENFCSHYCRQRPILH
jgi:hypothetical protein